MKKIFSFTLLCLSFVMAMAGTKTIKLNVKTPGSLSELVKTYKNTDLTSLSVSGTLNEADIKGIKRFIGYQNAQGQAEDGRLEKLDLGQTSLDDFESGQALCSLFQNAGSIKEVTIGNIFYLANRTFQNMPNLERVDFKGFIGHTDGYMFNDLPRLQSITFHKSILYTGGPDFVTNCPVLTDVTFKEAIVTICYAAPINCPMLKGYSVKAPILTCNDGIPFSATTSTKELKRYNWKETYNFLKRFYKMSTESSMPDFFLRISSFDLDTCAQLAKRTGDQKTFEELKALHAQCKRKFDNLPKKQSHLDLLKASAPYKRTGQTAPAFSYASPNDSLLTRTRNYFNLDKVAGTGDDLSRIKNLLYWLHDLVRHNGSSKWPECNYNCVDLYELCKKENRPLNCRFMAMMLCEALLAENIPARYLVCMSEDYKNDPDCHVITVAWSRQLNKWVWVDPTFCAYVTDENGLWLHPGEVRERLRNGQPLRINDDANWNHEQKQNIEDYLYDYMAKNLYLIETNMNSKSEPEAADYTKSSAHYLTLIPEGFNLDWNSDTTTDDEYFWQAPEKELVK